MARSENLSIRQRDKWDQAISAGETWTLFDERRVFYLPLGDLSTTQW
jgi:hypothetical protein